MQRRVETSYNVAVIGSTGSGKTQLLKRIVEDKFEQTYMATIGVDLKKKQFSNGEVRFSDCSSEQNYLSTSKMYVNKADCILFCINLSESNDFKKIIDDYQLDSIDKPIILVFTKSDEKAQSNQDMYKSIVKKQLSDKKIQIAGEYTTSAKKNIGIKDLIDDVQNRLKVSSVLDAMWKGTSVQKNNASDTKAKIIEIIKALADPNKFPVLFRGFFGGTEIYKGTDKHMTQELKEKIGLKANTRIPRNAQKLVKHLVEAYSELSKPGTDPSIALKKLTEKVGEVTKNLHKTSFKRHPTTQDNYNKIKEAVDVILNPPESSERPARGLR